MKTNQQQMINDTQPNQNNPTMIFPEINDIDFDAPWLMHILPQACNPSLYNDSNSIQLFQCLNSLIYKTSEQPLTTGQGKALKFVHQSVLDAINSHRATEDNNAYDNMAYETYIANTGQIPTRDNLHDLFNAWIWLTFPKTKAMLNRHQAEQIAQDGVSSSRGRVRDAVTVFDENGAVLITANPDIATALKSFDWQQCLVKPRHQWLELSESQQANDKNDKQAMVMICGHALLEQLTQPRKPLCSHTFILQVDKDFFELPMRDKVKKVDELLAIQVDKWLQGSEVSPRDLSPLPVLGIPHFWQENAHPEFYQDPYVFRTGRRKKVKNR